MSDKQAILIVDDEPLNRDLVRRVIGSRYAVLEAGDAAEALRLLEERGPVPVIVCDHLMPGRNGTEVASDVHARWPSTVTLLITGYDSAPEVVDAVASGAIWQVVSKPYNVKALSDLIAQAMVESRRRAGE